MESSKEELIEYDLKLEFKKIFKKDYRTIFFVLPLLLLSLYTTFTLTTNIYQTVSMFFMILFLSIASIQDFQEKMVFEFLLYPVAFFSIFFINDSCLTSYLDILKGFGFNLAKGTIIVVLMWGLVFLLSKILKKEAMGLGDFPIFFAFINVLGFYTPIGLIIMSLTAIIYKIATPNEETIPLIPFLFLGMISTYFIYNFENGLIIDYIQKTIFN